MYSMEQLRALPAPDRERVRRLLRREIERSGVKIVVLDDDPTGVQTVHDVSVFTDWSVESIREGLTESGLFYILTNSRGLTAQQSAALHREIADNIHAAAAPLGCAYLIVSRSDSTLRGHYPLETEVLRERWEANTGLRVDGEILCPFFKEGGRYTLDDVHYVQLGEELVPAGETEFARDKTFGYRASNVREYIEEKTGGRYPAASVATVPLRALRAEAYDEIERQLLALRDFNKLFVNAADYCDLEVFCVALYRAIARGRHFLFRSAASLVKVMGGISDAPLLRAADMCAAGEENGGLIVVGSHTGKTTAQLERMLELPGIVPVEFDVGRAVAAEDPEALAAAFAARLDAHIAGGETVCLYTSRRLMTADTGDREDDLRLSVRISELVRDVVGGLRQRPRFLIAKGGITSATIGTEALRVRRALVLGQVQPGVPVWRTGEESRFPGMPYVIFPGNVGREDTLKTITAELMDLEEEQA